MLNSQLLSILRCPKCRGLLVEQAGTEAAAAAAKASEALVCNACRLRYAVEDGIPNLFIDEAQKVTDAAGCG